MSGSFIKRWTLLKTMKILKNILKIFLDWDSWLSVIIELPFWAAFWFCNMFILISSMQPWWLKLVFMPSLSILLYIFHGLIARAIFKKPGKNGSSRDTCKMFNHSVYNRFTSLTSSGIQGIGFKLTT